MLLGINTRAQFQIALPYKHTLVFVDEIKLVNRLRIRQNDVIRSIKSALSYSCSTYVFLGIINAVVNFFVFPESGFALYAV